MMRIWSENQLIQYFRQKFQTRVFLEIVCLICLSLVLLFVIFQKWNWIFLIFISILEILLIVIVLFHLNIITEHPEKILIKEKLFRKYGDPKQVARMIESLYHNLIYNDNLLLISNEYIMANARPETLTHADDLVIIWPSEILKTINNSAEIVGYQITWYNIYGEKFQVQYGDNAKQRVANIMQTIQEQFPWVHIGKKHFLEEFLQKKIRPLPKLNYGTEMEHTARQVVNIREAKVVKRPKS